jgi:hypothetical protein
MAYDYDVDILAAYWTGAEALEEPYASFIAANPTLTDEVSENRILSTIELLRSHMEMLQNREEAKLLHESISKLFRHSAGGSNPWSDAAAITSAEGNVPNPIFPAGASIDITVGGVTASPASASGGNCVTVVAELNASLGGTPGSAESVSLDFTGVTGGTLPTGVVPAAWFDVTVPGGTTYRFWFGDLSTTPPAVTTEILKPIPFGGAETDQQISDLALVQILAADAELAGATNGGGTTPAITCTMASVGNVTDPVDGAVSTGATIATTVQGVDPVAGTAPVEAYCIQPGGRLGFRGTSDFITMDIANGSGGIIGPAGIIPGVRRSTPARVSDQGRDLALGHFAGTPRDAQLTP